MDSCSSASFCNLGAACFSAADGSATKILRHFACWNEDSCAVKPALDATVSMLAGRHAAWGFYLVAYLVFAQFALTGSPLMRTSSPRSKTYIANRVTPSFQQAGNRSTLDTQKKHHSARKTSHLKGLDYSLDHNSLRKVAVEIGISESTTFHICPGLATVDLLLTEVRPGYAVARTSDLARIHRTHCECCPLDHLYARRMVTAVGKIPDNWKLSYSLARHTDQELHAAQKLDPFQRALAHQLLPQQPINSGIHLTEVPHCKDQCVALQAIHSPRARYSGSGAPSTNRSKGMQSAQSSKDSLQRKRPSDYQQVLPWQVALTVNLDLQASNSGTSFEFAEKQDIKTCETPAHCCPPSTIRRSNNTQPKFASAVQNSQTTAVNNATIESYAVLQPTLANKYA